MLAFFADSDYLRAYGELSQLCVEVFRLMGETPTPGLGRAIAVRRTELGLKRRQLADRAELSYPYISEIENGLKEPSSAALRRIAEALDSDHATLLAKATQYAEEVISEPTPTWADAVYLSESRLRGPSTPRGFRPSPWVAPLSVPDDLEERIRVVVRGELEAWAAYRLPALIREVLDQPSAPETQA